MDILLIPFYDNNNSRHSVYTKALLKQLFHIETLVSGEDQINICLMICYSYSFFCNFTRFNSEMFNKITIL